MPRVDIRSLRSAATASGTMSRSSRALTVAAPFLSLGASWAVRRGLSKSYSRATGRPAPNAYDGSGRLVTSLAWAVTTAVLITAVDVVINRVVSSVANPPAEAQASAT